MRCPECDYDIFDEKFGDYYETIYICKKCGCNFKEGMIITKEGKKCHTQ